MEKINVLHFYHTRASVLREVLRKKRRYPFLVAFNEHVGPKNLEKYIATLPLAWKLRFSELLSLQDSTNLLLVFYGLLYVVIEGYEAAGVRDAKIDALLESENVKLMKRCRHYVFHFQTDLLSSKLTDFILTRGTETWTQELFGEFGRFLTDHTDRYFSSLD